MNEQRCAMRKVCKSSKTDIEILKLLYQNKEGLRVSSIKKMLDLKQRVVYKRLELLREQKIIENIYPIWRISNGQYQYCATLIGSSNIFELHNISYVVKLMKTPEWWAKRKNYLIRLKEYQFKQIDFGKGGTNAYQQLINENFVIQAYPESLIIIARKRYYANNPYETIQKAMDDILSLLDWFCERFKFNFFADGIPHIEVRNNDFNRMNDALANQVRKEKGKFLVEIDNKRKVWVDMSEPFGKEANYPEAQEKLEKVTKDLLIKKSYLPSELTTLLETSGKQIAEIIQVQQMHSNNIIKHQKVLDEMLVTLKAIQNSLQK